MFIFHLFIFLLCVYGSQQRQYYNDKKFRSWYVAEETHNRVAELMRSYYEEANSRLTYLNPLRFMYEESPYYEMGYIISEIIERYRKVIEHTQRPVRFHMMTLYDIAKRVEYVQKLYFELYHLTKMMHETPRKWVAVLEYSNMEKIAGPENIAGMRDKDALSELSLAELFETQAQLRDQEKRREREKRQKKKEADKIRKIYAESLQRGEFSHKSQNTMWPIDYGWEIDYMW